ncbi:hypothetical protein H696_00163 [Fonticula alba]|uniref:DUS-like FMN-binding domain-containing protein n=1 Tax=Fonticula alba TaxID=691883 RepID=A0A058ZGF8_FONAL|nr:hypothetical protein H696_00163 [Fonticula alba]KCV72572.1 hypothetical protein H696_00163 [Fonticula alba]|eukprot:XP_009492273.1 hypothetical protein H696_00163 [Fonticula alba]
MLRTVRVENHALGTVDYVDSTGKVIFQTCARERGRVIFQIGTSDPERAVRVAKMVHRDVAAIDLNMGCPKPFSTSGGMGSALLDPCDRAVNILKALKAADLSCPVTCKIRFIVDAEEREEVLRAHTQARNTNAPLPQVLTVPGGQAEAPDSGGAALAEDAPAPGIPGIRSLQASQRLVDTLSRTGVAAIGIHTRFPHTRPREAPTTSWFGPVSSAAGSRAAILLNGVSSLVHSFEDIQRLRESMHPDGAIMLARAAHWNCSVFRREGPLPLRQVARDFMRICAQLDHNLENAKYILHQMCSVADPGRTFCPDFEEEDRRFAGELAPRIAPCLNLRELYALVEDPAMFDYFARGIEASRREHAPLPGTGEPSAKRLRLGPTGEPEPSEDGVVRVPLKLTPRLFTPGNPPKQILNGLTSDSLKYETVRCDTRRAFRSTVTLDSGKAFGSENWFMNKKTAEHAAAVVALRYGLAHPELGVSDVGEVFSEIARD